jgi:hypothetical protein
MATPNINIINGLQISNDEITLTFCDNSKGQLSAKFTTPFSTDVVYRRVKNWNQATASICVFLELSGEPREEVVKKVEKIIHGLQTNLVH